MEPGAMDQSLIEILVRLLGAGAAPVGDAGSE
jgi:hypothetical protein